MPAPRPSAGPWGPPGERPFRTNRRASRRASPMPRGPRKWRGFDRHAGRRRGIAPEPRRDEPGRIPRKGDARGRRRRGGVLGGPKGPPMLRPELALRVGEGGGDLVRQPRAELAVEVAELAERLPPLAAVDLQRLGDLRA